MLVKLGSTHGNLNTEKTLIGDRTRVVLFGPPLWGGNNFKRHPQRLEVLAQCGEIFLPEPEDPDSGPICQVFPMNFFFHFHTSLIKKSFAPASVQKARRNFSPR